MRKICHVILAASVLALGACHVRPPASASTPAPAITGASGQLDAIAARYDQAKAFAELLLPILPPERAAMIRRAAAVVEAAIALARSALSVAERANALRAVDEAVASYTLIAGA